MYKTPHSALAAVMRRDAAKAADFARRHGVPKSYTDADALIADPGVDIVYVATPPDSHRELALKVLAAGKPVYVEKPMAMNHAECLDMIAAAERSGQRLFVAYYRRALPYFLKVKELLDSGAIGEVLSVEVRYFRPESPGDRDPARLPWRLRREVGGEGYFCDMAPHTLDILDFLLGEIADARGCKTNRGGFYDVADTVAASFRFRSGVPGTGMWCFVRSALRCGGFGGRHGPQRLGAVQHVRFHAGRTGDGAGCRTLRNRPSGAYSGPADRNDRPGAARRGRVPLHGSLRGANFAGDG